MDGPLEFESQPTSERKDKKKQRNVLVMKHKNSSNGEFSADQSLKNSLIASNSVLSRVNKRVEDIIQRYKEMKILNNDTVSKQFQKDFLQKQQD